MPEELCQVSPKSHYVSRDAIRPQSGPNFKLLSLREEKRFLGESYQHFLAMNVMMV